MGKCIPSRGGYNSRKGIHPYTFLPDTRIFKNRGTKAYEDNPRTIGGHIRKKRVESKLLQREVAEQLSVSEDTLTYWENERYLPQVNHYPAIIAFLGYYPFDHETESLGGKLKQIRCCMGMSFKQCAALMQVSADAAKRWERGKPVAYPSTRQLIETVWQNLSNR